MCVELEIEVWYLDYVYTIQFCIVLFTTDYVVCSIYCSPYKFYQTKSTIVHKEDFQKWSSIDHILAFVLWLRYGENPSTQVPIL